MKTSNPVLRSTLAALALALSACASLPDTGRELERQPAQPVAFEGAHGSVSAGKSEAIIEKLDGGHQEQDVLAAHLAQEQAINPDTPLVLGNKLTLLQNGPATYAAMFAAIKAATDHINLETYIFEDDAVGQKFADLLLVQQAAGVKVSIIYDGVGGQPTAQAFFDRLTAGGIQVLQFNPVNPLAPHSKTWRINNRDHRKLLVIDGRIAFVGGVNISSDYSSAPSGGQRVQASGKPSGWRDTHVQIEGPVVAEFQKLFVATWAKQKGKQLDTENYLPKLAPLGDEIVRAIGSAPTDPQSLIYLTLMSAIAHAQTQVHLTIAYFAPDPQLLKALIDAAHRGVDVSLILPSHSDSWPIFNLGRSFYSELLRGGVKIQERRGAVMHSKTACIDGVWSTIGSTNLDWRSFLHNDEINAVILGRGFAAQMEAMFAQDLAESDAIDLKQWQQRPLSSRLKEWTARRGEYWL